MTKRGIPAVEANPWQFEPGRPPSYPAAARYRFLKTVEMVNRLDPSSILEVAAGGGFSAAVLKTPGRRIVVNDLRSVEPLHYWTTGDGIEVAPGNCFDLEPGRLGAFDLVMACELIEHVAHGPKLIQHLARFLAPGGALLLTTPNGRYFRSKLPTYSQVEDFGALEDRQFQPDADGHLFLYTPDELRELLLGCGFEDVRIELAITPWISGNAAFRYLPRGRLLTPLYFTLDRLTTALLPPSVVCNQMFVVARRR